VAGSGLDYRGDADAAGSLSGGGADWLDVPVWVDLDKVYGKAPDDVKPWPGGNLIHGLVLSGNVPGRLQQWGRATDGRWVGLVDIVASDYRGATVAWMPYLTDQGAAGSSSMVSRASARSSNRVRTLSRPDNCNGRMTGWV
jgi:hypothetical protein